MRQFAQLKNDKQAVSIGFVGYPNVGRPSVINILHTKNVCKIAPIPGERKVWQYIILTKRVFLIDCPDVVYHNKDSETDVVLKGVVRVTNFQDAADHIGEVWKLMKKEHWERVYKIKEWEDETDLLVQLCKSTSKLLKDGEPDLMNTAKMVLHDWHQDVEGNAHSDRQIQVPFAWFYALSVCLVDEAALLLLYSALQGKSAFLQYVFVLTDMDTLLLSILETLDDFLCSSISSNTHNSQYRVLEWQQVAAKIGMQCCAASVQWLNERITLHIEMFSTEDKVKGFVMRLGFAKGVALDIWNAPSELAFFLAWTVSDDVLASLNLEESNCRLPPKCNGSETLWRARSLEVGLSSFQQWDPGGKDLTFNDYCTRRALEEFVSQFFLNTMEFVWGVL